MAHYRIVEWATYQHYKDRSPPWIKLHANTMTSQTWVNLDNAGRVLAIACMLVAADTDNRIPDDPAFMRRRAYLEQDPDFGALVRVGFIELVSDSKGLARERKRAQPPDKRALASGTECASEESRAEESRGDGARARKTTIPPDWKPTPELIEYAKAQGCADPADTFERFRLNHAGKGTLHKDWTSAAQYWCRNEKNFRRAEPPKSGPPTTPAEPWEQRMSGWHGRKFWMPMWGPRPGEPGCMVPKAYLQ